jgi:DsbC/DsbD-like thiol-disulfide interchange protein
MLFCPRNLLAVLLAAATLFSGTSASALESPWVGVSNADVRLVADAAAIEGAPLRAGIEIRLARGWHTYWRYPGDAGVPPRFDWTGSRNVAAVEVRWPAPERITLDGGLESIGYHGNLILPLTVRAADRTKPVALRLRLDFGVCEKICIPADALLQLEIPSGTTKQKLSSLDAAERRVPVPTQIGKHGSLAVLGVRIERGATPRAAVDVTVPAGKPFDLFAEGPDDTWALPLPKRTEATNGRARFAVALDGAPSGASPTPRNLRLTLVAGEEAIEVVAPLD